ncbi:MAG: hypothetical protein ACK4VO_08610 [Pseudobdellovibrio sp.]
MVQVIHELSSVLIFCSFYSAVVVFSLWITAFDQVKNERKLQ